MSMFKKLLGLCLGVWLFTVSFSVFAASAEESSCNDRGAISSYGKTAASGTYWKRQENKCVCQPSDDNCCGVPLYTNVPFVGKCIQYGPRDGVATGANDIPPVNAFPVLLQALSKILLSVILIMCFGAIVVAGVMISSGNDEQGKSLITHVVVAMALLWASGVILRLINPNFFQ